jgi:hypothetical protein
MVMVVGGNQERKKVIPITGSRIAVVVSVVLEALWEAGFASAVLSFSSKVWRVTLRVGDVLKSGLGCQNGLPRQGAKACWNSRTSFRISK